jgi:hypothetical protein
MLQITSVLVPLDVAVTFFRSAVVLTPNDNFLTVSLLQSVSDIIGFLDSVHHLALETEHSVLDTGSLSISWWKGPKAPMHMGLFTTANVNDGTNGPIIELSHWLVTRWGCTPYESIRKSRP